MIGHKLWWDVALKRGRLVNLTMIVEWQILGGCETCPKSVLVLCSMWEMVSVLLHSMR